MIHQRTKDIFFTLTKGVTKLINPILKLKFRKSKNLKLHFGSGNKLLKGFVNIDGNPTIKGTLYYDIRNPLPFADETVDYIYTSNTLEHFFPDELQKILESIYRILSKGGIVRIVVPDLRKSIQAYQNNDFEYFNNWPKNYKSIGGRFSNFIFCDAQHKITFDFNFMKELLNQAGFSPYEIREVSPDISGFKEDDFEQIKKFESNYRTTNLFVEAIK